MSCVDAPLSPKLFPLLTHTHTHTHPSPLQVLAGEAQLAHPQAFVYFPVMVHAFDIIVSSMGILSLGDGRPGSMPDIPFLTMLGYGADRGSNEIADPMSILKRGYVLSISCAVVVFLVLCRTMLHVRRTTLSRRRSTLRRRRIS